VESDAARERPLKNAKENMRQSLEQCSRDPRYALLPGDATEKVAMRWMEDKDKRAGAFRLFWVALAKMWRSRASADRASGKCQPAEPQSQLLVSVRARNYTWRVDGQQ
jgi:hypothetical protein